MAQGYGLVWLVENVKSELELAPYIYPSIKRGLDKFVNEVNALEDKDGNLCHLQLQNSVQQKSRSALDIFVRHVDGLIVEQFLTAGVLGQESTVDDRFSELGFPLPLAQHFTVKSRNIKREDGANLEEVTMPSPRQCIKEIAKCASKVAHEIEATISDSLDCFIGTQQDYERARSDVDTIRIIGVVLGYISALDMSSNRTPIKKSNHLIRYCDFCFRVAEHSSHHCWVHQNSAGITEQVSKQRQGRRKSKAQPQELKDFFVKNKKLGRLISAGGDEVLLVPCYPSYIDELVKSFLVGNTFSKEGWHNFLRHVFPILYSCLSASTLEAAEWSIAIQGVWRDLDNRLETSTEITYVLQILIAAEEWLNFDHKWVKEKLLTPSKSVEILRLSLKTNLSQAEIAKQVGCKPAYVSKVLKMENGKWKRV